MKKIDLGQTITMLANVGVIAGIVFLAIEFQQDSDCCELRPTSTIYKTDWIRES